MGPFSYREGLATQENGVLREKDKQRGSLDLGFHGRFPLVWLAGAMA
jgi:hypothetical protein